MATGFEENETILLRDRYLPEGLHSAICRLGPIALFQEARLVRECGFLQRPACTQIADLTSGETWDPFKSGDGDHRGFLTRSSQVVADFA
jgi:hypothetical protein